MFLFSAKSTPIKTDSKPKPHPKQPHLLPNYYSYQQEFNMGYSQPTDKGESSTPYSRVHQTHRSSRPTGIAKRTRKSSNSTSRRRRVSSPTNPNNAKLVLRGGRYRTVYRIFHNVRRWLRTIDDRKAIETGSNLWEVKKKWEEARRETHSQRLWHTELLRRIELLRRYQTRPILETLRQQDIANAVQSDNNGRLLTSTSGFRNKSARGNIKLPTAVLSEKAVRAIFQEELLATEASRRRADSQLEARVTAVETVMKEILDGAVDIGLITDSEVSSEWETVTSTTASKTDPGDRQTSATTNLTDGEKPPCSHPEEPHATDSFLNCDRCDVKSVTKRTAARCTDYKLQEVGSGSKRKVGNGGGDEEIEQTCDAKRQRTNKKGSVAAGKKPTRRSPRLASRAEGSR
ncbi:hypothetical protein HD806DRAFT_545167 [Xylariaceae sp. AK1471]|nr:hypothetical protein HD806DRAFT_545167 [Xylariaceae sp. AK1471]